MDFFSQLLILAAALSGIYLGSYYSEKAGKESLKIKLNHKERFELLEYKLRLYTKFVSICYETKRLIISPARNKEKVSKISTMLRDLDNTALEIQLLCTKDVFTELFKITNVFKDLYQYQKEVSYQMASNEKRDKLHAIERLNDLSNIEAQTNAAIKKFIRAIRKELRIKFQLQ